MDQAVHIFFDRVTRGARVLPQEGGHDARKGFVPAAALEDFAGCAVIISHDRWFLDRIATHILAFEGDSHVEWFEGNFQAYEQDKMRRLGTDSTIPHRIKYKKFSR